MQLSTPNQNTFGVTLPGSLGIVIGHNDSISWGLTNATREREKIGIRLNSKMLQGMLIDMTRDGSGLVKELKRLKSVMLNLSMIR